MIDELKKMQKKLFSFRVYDKPLHPQRRLTLEESLEVIHTVQSAMAVLRFRGCESPALRKVMQEFYYEVYETHPLVPKDPGEY